MRVGNTWHARRKSCFFGRRSVDANEIIIGLCGSINILGFELETVDAVRTRFVMQQLPRKIFGTTTK